MELTTELLSRYKGGQLEVQAIDPPRSVEIGKITGAEVAKGRLLVKFEWHARGKGYPATEWFATDHSRYETSLLGSTIANIGEERILMMVGRQIVIFLPPGHSRLLRPASIRGLT